MVDMIAGEVTNLNDMGTKTDIKDTAGALARLLIVFPWASKLIYFGNLSSGDVTGNHARATNHGVKVMQSIGDGLRHPDNIKEHFTKLRRDHHEKLQVEHTDFMHFLDMLMAVVVSKGPKELTPEVLATFKKAFTAVTEAPSE